MDRPGGFWRNGYPLAAVPPLAVWRQVPSRTSHLAAAKLPAPRTVGGRSGEALPPAEVGPISLHEPLHPRLACGAPWGVWQGICFRPSVLIPPSVTR
jgi:hypothetical protein